jgi:hypothetical protein
VVRLGGAHLPYQHQASTGQLPHQGPGREQRIRTDPQPGSPKRLPSRHFLDRILDRSSPPTSPSLSFPASRMKRSMPSKHPQPGLCRPEDHTFSRRLFLQGAVAGGLAFDGLDNCLPANTPPVPPGSTSTYPVVHDWSLVLGPWSLVLGPWFVKKPGPRPLCLYAEGVVFHSEGQRPGAEGRSMTLGPKAGQRPGAGDPLSV